MLCVYTLHSGSARKVLCAAGEYWLPAFHGLFADLASEACDLNLTSVPGLIRSWSAGPNAVRML